MLGKHSAVSDKEATVIRMQYLSWGQSDRLHLSGSFPQVWERDEREVGNGGRSQMFQSLHWLFSEE